MLGVTLPSPKQQTEGECTVTGWGTLSAGGQTPDVLMKVSDFIKNVNTQIARHIFVGF